MKKFTSLVALGCCLTAAAEAEPLSASVLQRDYENCMGGLSSQQDPQRAQYCVCVREGMKTWTMEYYGRIALESLKSPNPPAPIAALAKSCFEQVSH